MSPSTEDILSKARAFAAKVMRPDDAMLMPDGSLKSDVFLLAAAIGLTGLQVPRDKGGLGLPFSVKAKVAEILAEDDFGLAMAIINTQNAALRISRDGAAASYFLPELLAGTRIGCTALTEWSAGSDFAAIETMARKSGENWNLSGEKAWITNAVCADTFIVFAQTEKIGSVAGIASFLVDGRRQGFQRGALLAPGLQATTGSGSFRLNNYLAATNDVLAEPGNAFKTVMTEINGARIYVAAMCCGMLKASINDVTEYGKLRQTFGRPLQDHQGWRWLLAEAAADLAAATALVRESALALDHGEDVQLAAAKTKVMATRMIERHLPALHHAMGARGLQPNQRINRHLAAMPLASLVDGSTEILLERIAKLNQKT